MRRTIVFIILFAVLTALVIARAQLPEPSIPVMAESSASGYNIRDLVLPTVTETAGSAIIAEMNGYFLAREPTAKNAFTGVLRGKNLLLICADEWAPDPTDRSASPTLYRLAQESAQVTEVWRPDWYQGMEGRLFALLSGLVPTRVGDQSSLVYTGAQNIYLPFSLPRGLAREGYDCRAFLPDGTYAPALKALGFGTVLTGTVDASGLTEEALDAFASADKPIFAFCQWNGAGEEALALLWNALGTERRTDTALCLLSADADGQRAQLYLWGAGLSGAASALPCSELDLTPTLLNLVGADFDSRFLSGRDIFAAAPSSVTAEDTTPLVSLCGSAFSPWVTEAGRYDTAARLFTPDDGADPLPDEDAYIRSVCTLQYQRYIFSRRVMETNYFHLVFGGRE